MSKFGVHLIMHISGHTWLKEGLQRRMLLTTIDVLNYSCMAATSTQEYMGGEGVGHSCPLHFLALQLIVVHVNVNI